MYQKQIDVANNSDHIDHNSVKLHLLADHVDNATRCTAINWDYTCCTSANPCSIGEGDCDSDDQCYGDLKCGLDNCIGFGDSGADCCMLVGIHDNAMSIADVKVSVVLYSKVFTFLKLGNQNMYIPHFLQLSISLYCIKNRLMWPIILITLIIILLKYIFLLIIWIMSR